MKARNRLRYRNNVRLPVILLIVIVGSLVGLRWIREVRAHHVENRLSTQLRELNHEISTLSSHVSDLKGLRQAMLTEDVLNKALVDHRLKMDSFDPSTVIHISTRSDGAKAVAQNSTPVQP